MAKNENTVDFKACDLPVMKSHCATCPFKPDENGVWKDTDLANKVVQRTLFKAQQICHSTQDHTKKGKKSFRFRCKGAFDYNTTIYERMGFGEFVK